MKGIIVCCLNELVVEKFGKSVWEKTLEKSGVKKDTVFLAMDDVPDEAVLKVLGNLCKELNITLEQAADAFGEYWMVKFAPRVYGNFFLGVTTAREFLLKMDAVHSMTTKAMKNAAPPKFKYEQKDKNTLLMTYESKRNLTPVFEGLVKGVGKYFKENLKLKMVAPNQLEITFPN